MSTAVEARSFTVLAAVDDPAALTLATQLRTAIAAVDEDATVLDAATTTLRLRGPMGPAVPLAPIQTTLESAEDAFNALEHERSVSILESVIARMEREPDFSEEKLALLQAARLKAARRLVGLAGPAETGKAETKNGQRAQAHLEHALRANPTLVLDPVKTPPKLRSLLSLAAEAVKRNGHGSIDVTSKPAGATVVLEGRAMGLTPLATANTIATGRYRLWVTGEARQSFTRVLDVGPGTLPVAINLVVEGALWSEGPGLRMPSNPFDDDDVRHLVGVLGTDVVALVAVGDGVATVTSFTTDGPPKRYPLENASGDVATDAEVLARAIAGGGGQAVSPTLYQPSPVAASAAVAEDFPWAVVGGVGAAVAVVVAGAVTAGVLYATRETTISVSVKEVTP